MKSLLFFSRTVTTIFLILATYTLLLSQLSYSITKADSLMPVFFKGIEDEKIRKSFLKVLDRYEVLHPYNITLTRKRLETSTMQAQPVFSLNSMFGGVRSYEIKLAKYVRDSDKILVSDLPEDVLTGWFAHELGHLVDYEAYNGPEMLWYGLKYLFNEDFKRKAEHEADMFAINQGFDQEIIASKVYILENNFLGPKYQAQIRKYYMSIEDVRMCVKNANPLGKFKPLDL